MKVTLHSGDANLQRLCREAFPTGVGLLVDCPADEGHRPTAEPDLTIWDYSPEIDLPTGIQNDPPDKHLFLVERDHLENLGQAVPKGWGNYLMKPADSRTLRAAVEDLLRRRETPEGGDRADGLRADRDEILHSLLLANVTLNEYDHDRSLFLTRTVHDFRAPLTALSGYCGLLLAEQLGSLNEEQKDVLRRMLQSTKRLTRMANAIFELGIKRERDEAGLHVAAGDLRECIDRAVHEWTHAVDEKNLTISIDVATCPERVYFDPYQMEQVFVNLLDNACRFTPKRGSISISAYPVFHDRRKTTVCNDACPDRRCVDIRTPNCVRVDIADSGPVIPYEHRDKIFREYTSDAGTHDRSSGSLGLAVCRLIVSRHSGEIWVESRPEGALISLVIPLERRFTTSSATGAF